MPIYTVSWFCPYCKLPIKSFMETFNFTILHKYEHEHTCIVCKNTHTINLDAVMSMNKKDGVLVDMTVEEKE